jgi:hypothetical protein
MRGGRRDEPVSGVRTQAHIILIFARRASVPPLGNRADLSACSRLESSQGGMAGREERRSVNDGSEREMPYYS